MDLSIWHILLSVVAFYVFRHYFRIKFKNFPPGPLGVPSVGVLPFLGQHPERVFARWSKQFGPIISVRVGMNDMIVLNDYDSIYQVRHVIKPLSGRVDRESATKTGESGSVPDRFKSRL